MNLCSMFGTLVIGALSWVPSDVSQFWVEPDKPALLEFDVKKDETVESGSRSDSVRFVVRTTDGEMLKEGEGEIVGERLAIRTTLPQGYFELELPESNQAFGVASQPPFCPSDAILASSAKERNDLRLRDDFFGIDAASTWLVQDDKTREALIRNARRIGVATYRERLSWGRVEPQENVFDYNGDRNSETVRAAALKYDMPVLELFHSAPDWAGHVGTYPEDLIKTANSWGAIGKRWGRYWNSIEVWNEPDISFSGNLPADQYAPVLKTVAQELARKGITTPVVGGIIATFRDNFMDSFADNGGLDACDIFSFHTYCRAPEMESVCLRYHNWLVKNHAEWKPVWITECGRPWKKGTERPNREADLESAIDIVEKGVVAKAMGYDSYFPFVYVFYEENDNNFGMSDKNSAPLRSIAGYARMIYLLSGKDCIGNWKVDGSDAAWLFVDRENGEQIAVVYASERKKGRVVKLPCKPVFAERVTGEHVGSSDSNELDFSDGLLFVKLPYDFKAELNQSTEVDQARLLRVQAREKHGVDARRNDDVVMRFDYDKEVVSATNGGYSLLDPEIKELQGRLSVFNFSNESKTLPVSAEAIVNKSGSSEKIDVFSNVPDAVAVPARGRATIPFTIDLSKVSPFFPPTLVFKAGSDAYLSFELSRGFTEENFHDNVEEAVRIDISDQRAWQKSCSSNGSIEFHDGIATEQNKGWGFTVKYADDNDKWAYPLFTLPRVDGKLKPTSDSDKTYDLNEFSGVAFCVKGSSNADGGVLRFFTYSEKGTYYYTSSGFARADGKERFIVIPFKSIDAYGGVPDPFSPDNILRISIGGNSKGSEMKIEVGDFYFFK